MREWKSENIRERERGVKFEKEKKREKVWEREDEKLELERERKLKERRNKNECMSKGKMKVERLQASTDICPGWLQTLDIRRSSWVLKQLCTVTNHKMWD